MLRLTVRNELVPQNIWRYLRGVVYTDVVITGEYNVTANSEELVGTTEYMGLYTMCRIDQCPYKRVRLYHIQRHSAVLFKRKDFQDTCI
jgi:hypothetical protein